MAKQLPQSVRLSAARGRLLLLLLFLLLLYVILPQSSSFSESLAELKQARPLFVALAGGFLVVTYGLAAGMYYLLSFKPLSYARTLIVQTASGFTNRVLPAGLGVITLYVQYLRKSGHSLSQAIAVSGTNNLLGILLHMLLMAMVLVIVPGALLGEFDFSPSKQFWIIFAAAALVIMVNLLIFRRLRRYLYALSKEVFGQIVRYRGRPGRLTLAAVCSVVLTFSYVLTFYMCVLAVGAEVSFVQVFGVFTIGIVAATVTPTPGGVVGAEAGLTAGLVVYGTEASTALAAALLYRLLTYWLPLVPGFIVFVANRKLYL